MRLTRTISVTLLVLYLGSSLAHAETYYVDCLSGSDSAGGTSLSTAWRTLDKLAAMTFAPGDSILLKRGTSCAGQLSPKGSGDPERPIRIGAYGSGALPLIDAGNAESAIKLFNQRYWVIEALETKGGKPYGIFVSGTQRELRGFVLKNLVVHDVSGEPKSKVTGLVVFTAPEGVQMDDVLIDGITAYNTTQWAGIIVSGASREHRIRNVTIRNSIVHDVYGDGIVMFSVEDGLIERSAAWLTGLQPTETIGTPNAIWTWTCRRCTVRQTEGFFIDSPGVDGGVYDIDYGNDDNVVEDNYGHDAMGYCAAVFAAEDYPTEQHPTTNSIVRGNVCIDNGRSPKLARRQGDMFISTWDRGLLDGVRIENNTFYWSPLIDAPALMMDHADFTGDKPNIVADNTMFTTVSEPIHLGSALKLERNRVMPTVDAIPHLSKRLRLVLTGADHGQVIFLKTALVQYPNALEALLVVSDDSEDLAQDWNLGRVLVVRGTGKPGLQILDATGKVVAQWRGFVSPGELGLALRRQLGVPRPFATQ